MTSQTTVFCCYYKIYRLLCMRPLVQGISTYDYQSLESSVSHCICFIFVYWSRPRATTTSKTQQSVFCQKLYPLMVNLWFPLEIWCAKLLSRKQSHFGAGVAFFFTLNQVSFCSSCSSSILIVVFGK
jgi:hypothetical protein